MNEFFNWHDTGILFQHNWIWLLLAFLLGCWWGYKTCLPVSQQDGR